MSRSAITSTDLFWQGTIGQSRSRSLVFVVIGVLCFILGRYIQQSDCSERAVPSAAYLPEYPSVRKEPAIAQFIKRNVSGSLSEHYRFNQNEYCNNCDFDFYRAFLPKLSCCSDPSKVIIIGGMNAGQLTDMVLDSCRKPTIHGFEIIPDFYEELLLKYSATDRVKVNNIGMSNKADVSPYTNWGKGYGMSGLYTTFRGNTSWDGHSTIQTISLAEYVAKNSLQNSICLAIIDVEGHEAKVIQGMSLSKQGTPFSIFAYELGGTWPDSRNPSNWGQADAARYIINHGYDIFLMGRSGLLKVDSKFFSDTKVLNEGYGHFIQGNALAVHRSILTK